MSMIEDAWREIERQARFAVAGFGLAFAAGYGYWVWAEAGLPGQQLADPLLPCLWLGTLGAQLGLIVYFVRAIVAGIRRRLACRRRNVTPP
jgi:hypothetical protein